MQRVATKLEKTLDRKFGERTIDGVVIRICKNGFVLADNERTRSIKCVTETRPTDLVLEASVQATGSLATNQRMDLFFEVKKYAICEMADEVKAARGVRNRLDEYFQTSKGIKYLEPIRSRRPPEVINNIALLVLPNSEVELNHFLAAYKAKCGGGVFIHHLTNNDISDLTQCLEYFSRYHTIDLVCLLTENISNNHLALISSKENVKALKNYNRYTVSICSRVSDNHPTTSLVSNKTVRGISEMIDFVYETQKKVYCEIDDAVKRGEKILTSFIEEWMVRVDNARMETEMMGKPLTLGEEANEAIAAIKPLLLFALTKVQCDMRDRVIGVMSDLIRNPKIVENMKQVIESERKSGGAQKIENNTPCDIVSTLLHGRKDGHK